MPNIRLAKLSDLDAITTIYNEAIRTTTATFDVESKSEAEQLRWFEFHGPKYPILVAELAGTVVGWASLSPWSSRAAYSETAETSFYVEAEQRGKGIGRKLKQAIIDEACRLDFHSLVVRIAQGSDESIHLNEEFGFHLVGTLREVGHKFGQRLDVYFMQKMLK